LYAKARSGEIENFTGVDDIYEPPIAAEVTVDTINFTAEENARAIVDLLRERGFLNA
jgi:adenylylsulfate kinase-like enzyme